MKAKVKKRVVSRKKSTIPTKTKRVSTKRTSKRVKSKKRAADSAKPVKNSKTAVVRKKNPKNPHRYVKGQSGNPKGRPKGSKNKFSVTKMQEALEREALKAGYTSTYDYVAKQFFKDNHVLTAMMKKMLADLKSIEQVVISIDPVGDRKRSLVIQKKIAERMKARNKK